MTVYHFVGIKGTGMSPLAQILHDNGYTVQGSDIEKFIFTQTALEKEILNRSKKLNTHLRTNYSANERALFERDHEAW